MPLEPTYQLAEGPPAVSFRGYVEDALPRWRSLLGSRPPESVVQRFLEKHPAFVPGALSPGGATCASPLINLLVSQPRLPGFDGRQPDLLWFTSTSDTWYPVLIELERPDKRVFRMNGVPTADFTQARNQLNQWRAWFGEPTNQLKFQLDYGVPDLWTYRRTMGLHMLLIYGRRSEFETSPSLTRQRGTLLAGDDEELMSYDRIAPDSFLSDAITVRALGQGRYRALQVPPTLKLGPNHAERLPFLDGLNEAIDSSEGWTQDRRSFVKSRIPYWIGWSQRENQGWITVGDDE